MNKELDKYRVYIFNESMKITQELEQKLSWYEYKKHINNDREHFVATTLFMCMYFFEGILIKSHLTQEQINIINNSLIEEMNNRLSNPNMLKTTELFLKVRQALEEFSQKENINPIEPAIMFYLLEASHYMFEGENYNDGEYTNIINLTIEVFVRLLEDIDSFNIKENDGLFLATEYFFSVIITTYLNIEKKSVPKSFFEMVFKKIDYGNIAEMYREIRRASEDLGEKIYNIIVKKYEKEKLSRLLMVTNEALQELLDVNIVLNIRLNDKAKGREFTREEYDILVLDSQKARDVVQKKLEQLNLEFNEYCKKYYKYKVD